MKKSMEERRGRCREIHCGDKLRRLGGVLAD